MDYRKTLNLPRTGFAMRANLPQREPEILKKWQQMDIYRRVQEARAGAPLWVLHDGPPYANADIHLGQALNKILKDILVKYKTMRGFCCPYIPGWDTQGLPTETSVAKEYGLDRHEVDPLTWRAKCRQLAEKYVGIQKEQFQRLGVRGDWDNAYVTYDKSYQARELEAFGRIALKGLIYRGLRPVYWCIHCETALAEAEIEYYQRVSPSVWVAFPLEGPASQVSPDLPDDVELSLLVWTTTPWTLPGNTATAVHPAFDYVVAKAHGRHLVLAQGLLEQSMSALGLQDYQVLAQVKGEALAGLKYRHPLYDRVSPVVLADYVDLEQGSGCVHTAPGHGLEDFETSQKYDLLILSPLDDQGRFTQEAGPFAGMVCEQANDQIASRLRELGALLGQDDIRHEYPHCWRCKNPVIFRATEQWFMDIDKIRQAALKEIEKVQWVPGWSRARITGMVENRPDWCMSRQRLWGIPLPIFYCNGCDRALITEQSLNAVRDLVAEQGADAWFRMEAAEILPQGTSCAQCGGADFRKERDILDVWFDSGASHYVVVQGRDELRHPSDLYLEGDDQHRCWFQMSLLVAVALGGPAPYRTVLTHGFFVDPETREKESKSSGKAINPAEVVERSGADSLRWWGTYVDYQKEMPVSRDIFGQVADAYRRLRNTARFALGNLSDFDPQTHALPVEEMEEVDRWALDRLARVVERVTQAYETFELHLVYHDLNQFCAQDMSALYFDIIKDRLYTSPAGAAARRSAQTALWHILTALARLAAPVLTFTSEEIWGNLPGNAQLPESVQLADWPEAGAWRMPEEERRRWDRFLELRREVSKALELAKQQDVFSNPLEAAVDLYAGPEERELLASFGSNLRYLLIVSQANVVELAEAPSEAYEAEGGLALKVVARLGEGEKCERCWLREPTLGEVPDHPTICRRCHAALLEAHAISG
ncbi:MAG: isoleucine--tRNA ligase [Armatimonadota bacterium]